MICPFSKEGEMVIGDKEKSLLCIRTEVKSYFVFLEVFVCTHSKSLCDLITSGIVFLDFLAKRHGDISGSVPLGPGRKRHLEG